MGRNISWDVAHSCVFAANKNAVYVQMTRTSNVSLRQQKNRPWKPRLCSRDPDLLRAESTQDCQTWHVIGQSNGAHALLKGCYLCSVGQDISCGDVARYVSYRNNKKKIETS